MTENAINMTTSPIFIADGQGRWITIEPHCGAKDVKSEVIQEIQRTGTTTILGGRTKVIVEYARMKPKGPGLMTKAQRVVDALKDTGAKLAIVPMDFIEELGEAKKHLLYHFGEVNDDMLKECMDKSAAVNGTRSINTGAGVWLEAVRNIVKVH